MYRDDWEKAQIRKTGDLTNIGICDMDALGFCHRSIAGSTQECLVGMENMRDSECAVIYDVVPMLRLNGWRKFFARLGRIVWVAIIIFVAIGSTSTVAEVKSTRAFSCVKTKYLDVTYRCSPQTAFLGAAAGMVARTAFDGLCTNASDALWSVNLTSKTVPSPLVKGLNCGLWPRFANSRIWTLRVNGYPCVSTRFMILVITDGKIGSYSVWCHQIRDNSLLVNEHGG
jgi:hypothetical protein